MLAKTMSFLTVPVSGEEKILTFSKIRANIIVEKRVLPIDG